MNGSPWYMAGGVIDNALSADDFDGFVVGDIVNLVVGGPDMVVTDVCDECGEVVTHWVKVDGDIMSDVFPEEALYYA